MALSQPGIFNVLDTDYAGGMAPGNTPQENHDALEAAVNAALSSTGLSNGNGGTILIPSLGRYRISGEIHITAQTAVPGASLRLVGTAQGESDLPTLEKVDATDLFVIHNNKSGENVGGIVFQDLQIRYSSGLTAGAAIHVDHGQNVRAFRVVFNHCPVAVNFERSLQCSLLECTAVCGEHVQECVILGSSINHAVETYIAGCVFRTTTEGDRHGIGIRVNNTEHTRVVNTRVEGFKYGILCRPHGTSLRNHFANVSVREASTSTTDGGALVIQPQGGQVTETVFVGCEFAPTDNVSSDYAAGGVYVDATGGTVDTLRFVSCTSLNWNGPGLQILSGSNIEILGGEYSSNGKESDALRAGIAITGPASKTRIVGVSCGGPVSGAGTQQFGIYAAERASNITIDGCDLKANAAYGVYLSAVLSEVIISNCDLTGNGTGGIFLAGGSVITQILRNVFVRGCNIGGYSAYNIAIQFVSFTNIVNVQVTNCAGYNDRAPHLAAGSPPVGPFAARRYFYFGPIAFYVWGGTGAVTIDGVPTGLTSGGFTLGAGEDASIASGGSPSFLAIGK